MAIIEQDGLRPTKLFPEQARALDYARRKGSETPIGSVRGKVATAFRELEDLLDSVPEEAAARSPAPGCWSVHEIVDHLVVSHRRAVEELASLVAGDSPQSGPIPAGLVSADPFANSWSAIVADLKGVHHDFLTTLAGATEDTSLTARAPIVMVVKCEMPDGRVEAIHWIESFDWKAYAILFRAHTLEHLQQMQRILSQ